MYRSQSLLFRAITLAPPSGPLLALFAATFGLSVPSLLSSGPLLGARNAGNCFAIFRRLSLRAASGVRFYDPMYSCRLKYKALGCQRTPCLDRSILNFAAWTGMGGPTYFYSCSCLLSRSALTGSRNKISSICTLRVEYSNKTSLHSAAFMMVGKILGRSQEHGLPWPKRQSLQ